MTTTLQFQKGASVLTKNGIEVGTVDRVVVNPITNELAGIVVRSGGLLKSEEKVVPAHWIADATEELVLLQEEAGVLESLPPFEEERLVSEPGEETRSDSGGEDQIPLVIGNPMMGVPISQPPGSHEPATRIAQNIPEGTVAVKEGAKVIAAEGEHVGNVERFLADPSAEEVTHLLISKGLLTKEKKLIPMEWVMSWSEDQVHLRVNKDSVEELADASLAV